MATWVFGVMLIVGATQGTPATHLVGTAHADLDVAARPSRLVVTGMIALGAETGAETVGVHPRDARVAVSLADVDRVAVLDMRDPRRPQWAALHDVPVPRGGSLTCVTWHPDGVHLLVTHTGAHPGQRGRLLMLHATSGRIVRRMSTGHHPDRVTVSPDGRTFAVANEGEGVAFDRRANRFVSWPGGVTLGRLPTAGSGATATPRDITFKDQSARPGIAGPGRHVERTVDIDGNGSITEMETDVRVPLAHGRPWLEPEGLAFGPDGKHLYVTLQENNILIQLEAETGRILRVRGLGTTRHLADTRRDGKVAFEDMLEAWREPDGVAVTPGGRFVVTADEGDTGPRAGGAGAGEIAGGGRTVSVFRARDLTFVADTGDALARAVHAVGSYDDGRSGDRGVEPEDLVCFVCEDRTYAAVSLERANAVALVEVLEDGQPRVLGVTPLPPEAVGPEGIALLPRPEGPPLLVCACEKSGHLVALQFRCR